jgi:glyoxylase-like metal-dependent hydrolase (beta-lactamase superfamily II)
MNGVSKLNEYVSMLTFPFGEMRSHLYLIHDQDEAALIDAHVASMSEEVIERIQEVIPLDHLKTVILTHGHMDHIGAAHHIQEKTKASIAVHIADAQYVEEPWTMFLTLYQDLGVTKQNYDDFQSMTGDKPVKVSNPLHHGDTIQVGSVELQIHHTPGHSPGSICIYDPKSKMMFTGDALIPKEWYPTTLVVFQDAVKYIQSLTRLSEMEIDTLCPGHGKVRQGSEIMWEFKAHFDRYSKIEETIPFVLKDSESMSLWKIFDKVADKVLESGEHVPGIGALVTLKGFLNKLSFEGNIVQEKGSFVLSDYDKCPSCRCELKCKEYVVSDRRKEST